MNSPSSTEPSAGYSVKWSLGAYVSWENWALLCDYNTIEGYIVPPPDNLLGKPSLDWTEPSPILHRALVTVEWCTWTTDPIQHGSAHASKVTSCHNLVPFSGFPSWEKDKPLGLVQDLVLLSFHCLQWVTVMSTKCMNPFYIRTPSPALHLAPCIACLWESFRGEGMQDYVNTGQMIFLLCTHTHTHMRAYWLSELCNTYLSNLFSFCASSLPWERLMS